VSDPLARTFGTEFVERSQRETRLSASLKRPHLHGVSTETCDHPGFGVAYEAECDLVRTARGPSQWRLGLRYRHGLNV